MENRPEENMMPIGIPPEKPQKKADKAAVVVLAAIALLLIAIVAGVAFVLPPLIRNASDRIRAFNTWQEERRQSASSSGNTQSDTGAGTKGDRDQKTDAGTGASKDAGNDRTDAAGSASKDAAKNSGPDENAQLPLLEQIKFLYRDDFIEEDVVSLTEDLFNENGYRATIRYFFPSFQETSDVACAFFIRFSNEGDDTCAFCVDDYQVNARMVLESDYVTVEQGESEYVLFYLTRELLEQYRASGDVKSAGFRLEVMEGGYTGEVKPALLDRTFLYHADGEETSGFPDAITEGTVLYEDDDITFRLVTLEKQPAYNRLRVAYYVQNRSEHDMYVNPQFIADGMDRAALPVKSVSNLTAHSDLYVSGYLEAADFREGLGIDRILTMEVKVQIDIYDPAGAKKWTPLISETVEVKPKS